MVLALSLNDITIQLGEQRFFAHISWEIKKGQHWAILGATGSGKSLLTRAIAGKIPLSEGYIRYYFDDEHADQGRSYHYPGEIGILSAETQRDFMRSFASYHQARWQSFEGEATPTVAELLSLARSNKKAPASNEQQIIARLGLECLLERKVIHLSHGEGRKVLLARWLLAAPKLLILDEPFLGLDQETRLSLSMVLDELVRCAEPQILFVSTRPEDVPSGIEHFLVVEKGQIWATERRSTTWDKSHLESALVAKPTPERQSSSLTALDSVVREYILAQDEHVSEDTAVLVRMKDVSVSYNGCEVLKNVTWIIRRGERWALLGNNGAGKSTLLSLILADNPQAYANVVEVFGRQRGSGESIWEIKQHIGWVSPELHIFYQEPITCLEIVCSGFFDSVGIYRPPSHAQVDIARRWLSALEMDALAEMPFYRLSAGQQRLTLLARALVKNPPLLILDEPCQNLDGYHRRRFTAFLDQVCARTPLTMIYVSHAPNEIPSAITHCLRLERGKVSSSRIVKA